MIENWSTKKYNVIYADPPWSYYNDSTAKQDCTTIKGMRRPPYPVMGSKDIMALPVKDITDENCILFCWTTDYHLSKCLDVMKAWGFEYKTVGFAWSKRNKDGSPVCFMGAYTMKSGIELCLIGTKYNDAFTVKCNSGQRRREWSVCGLLLISQTVWLTGSVGTLLMTKASFTKRLLLTALSRLFPTVTESCGDGTVDKKRYWDRIRLNSIWRLLWKKLI